MKKKSPPKKKVKVKPLKQLPKTLGDEAYAYTAALLEDVNSNFRIFAENQSILSDKVDGLTYETGIVKEEISGIKISQELMREDITAMKGDITTMKGDITAMKGDISKLDARQTRMEKDITEIKQELKSIRSEMAEFRILLSQKADIERFNRLEERVARIEQELQSRQ